MCFVNYRNSPRHISYDVEVTDEGVVGRHEYIELQIVRCVRTIFVIPFVFAQYISPNTLPVMVDATLHVGPAFEFTTPVFDCAKRDLMKAKLQGAVSGVLTMRNDYCGESHHLPPLRTAHVSFPHGTSARDKLLFERSFPGPGVVTLHD